MEKNIYQIIFLFLTVVVLLTSCVDQKQVVDFQKAPNQSDTITVARPYVPKIQSGDILSISVGSLNPLASSFFNPYSTMPVTTDNIGSNPSSSMSALMNNSTSIPLTQSAAPGFLVD